MPSSKTTLGKVLESIKSAPIPTDLKDTTNEEEVYSETEEEAQSDHKDKEALDAIKAKATESLQEYKLKNKKLEIENQNLQTLAKHRINFSWAIFAFVIAFVLFALSIVVLSGISEESTFKLNINDNVLDIILATNTVQVVGVLYIVAKWLYPASKESK
jgi:hypothetical protein